MPNRTSLSKDSKLSITKTGKTVFVSILVAVVIAAGCGGRESDSTSQHVSAGETDTDGWLRGFNVRHERFRPEDGAREALFSADNMTLDEEGRFIMRDAVLETATANGRTVIARAARILADSQGQGDATLDGGVEVNIDDMVIATESATWHADTDSIESNGPVTVQGVDLSLRCGRFAMSVATRALSVYGVAGYIGIQDTTMVPGGAQG